MRILITGISTRAIAESARAAGYDFITLDYFGDYDQKSWCENYSLKRDFGLPFGADRLYEASRNLNFDAVIYTSNLENHPQVVRKFEARCRLLGNGAAVLSRVRHWPDFFEALAREGVPVPRTIYGREEQRPPTGHRWLRKPVRSGGGHSIAFWPDDRPAKGDFILQEYVPGLDCSASFVANGEKCVLLGVTEQLIGRREFGAAGFRYCGNILPLALAEPCSTQHAIRGTQYASPLLAQLREVANILTREFGLVGVNGLDFVLKEGHAYPVEINPRYSASMELIEMAHGLSIFDLHVRAVLEGELPDFDLASEVSGRQFHGKAIVYAERDCRAPDTRGWPERGIRDVPFPGEPISRGSPVCTVLATRSTREDCYASLVAKAEEVKGELYA